MFPLTVSILAQAPSTQQLLCCFAFICVLEMTRTMYMAVVFLTTITAAQAQCQGGGECPSNDANNNLVVSLLQAKLKMNVLTTGGAEAPTTEAPTTEAGQYLGLLFR